MKDMIGLYIVIGCAMLVLQFFIAKQFEEIACHKGFCEKKYFHWCFWLGLIGYLMVIALPTREVDPAVEAASRKETDAKSRKSDILPDYENTKSGKCQWCDEESERLTFCKVEDELGTRYRYMCPKCMEKMNIEKE